MNVVEEKTTSSHSWGYATDKKKKPRVAKKVKEKRGLHPHFKIGVERGKSKTGADKGRGVQFQDGPRPNPRREGIGRAPTLEIWTKITTKTRNRRKEKKKQ